MAIGDADAGAKDESCALLEHGGGVDYCHRVHEGIVGELPFLTRQQSVFY